MKEHYIPNKSNGFPYIRHSTSAIDLDQMGEEGYYGEDELEKKLSDDEQVALPHLDEDSQISQSISYRDKPQSLNHFYERSSNSLSESDAKAAKQVSFVPLYSDTSDRENEIPMQRTSLPLRDDSQSYPNLISCNSVDSTRPDSRSFSLSHSRDSIHDVPSPKTSNGLPRRSESGSISSSHVVVGRGAVSSITQPNLLLTMHRQLSNSDLCSDGHHVKKLQSGR